MKKIMTLALVTLMIFSLAATAGASAPSITAFDLSSARSTQAVNQTTGELIDIDDLDIPLAGDFAIVIIDNVQDVQDELDQIRTFLQEKALPIIEYFDYDETKGIDEDGEVKKQIGILLPKGFDASTLVMNEFVTAQSFFYVEEIGDAVTSFVFATPYEEDQIAVAVCGIFDAQGNVEWTPIEAKVEKDPDDVNYMKIHFTKDLLTKANNLPFALAILSE